MILRKPYAFLIKHFRSINFALFVLVVFGLTRVLKLYSFITDYLNTGIYNITLDPISNYINVYTYLTLFLIILVSGILIYLLRRKEKPVKAYFYAIGTAILTLILFIYVHNYFTFIVSKGYNEQMARLIRDLVLINSFFFYPAILVLLIRFLGIDLNSFGFKEDKDILASEEDREEVEVEVTFDKYKYIRQFKNKLRYSKYFILEHLYAIIPITVVVLLVIGFSTYKYIFVENKVYKENQTFNSNGYSIKVNRTYLTDKDYAGNTVSSQSRFYVVIDTSIKNNYYEREFDYSNLTLYVGNEYYLPTLMYNKSFSDLGKPYEKNDSIARNKTKNYIFVYEVTKPDEKANFLLKYQDYDSKEKKQIRIKLRMLDISKFVKRDTVSLGETLKVQMNDDLYHEFKLSNLEIVDRKAYTYESCDANYNCPMVQKDAVAAKNKKIVFFKIEENNRTTNEFISMLNRYGKIKYIVEGKEYVENIKIKVNNYKGNYAYLETSDLIENANKITLVFTVRTNQFFYNLKG